MGKNSAIEWTDDTINFWWGCVKVSPGCEHCYAETMSKRTGRNIWGPAKTTDRWRTKGSWKDILKWDREAKAEGKRRKVFAQSMSDFFEDHPQVKTWREEAIEIFECLEWVDILLLTKRIENVMRMVPARWLESWPEHIWMGTSIENQEYADRRIPELIKIPARIRFLSCEPLLGPLNIQGYLLDGWHKFKPKISWVIAGGESGPKARPMHPKWVKQIRDKCQEAGVPFFFKQWGRYRPLLMQEYPPPGPTVTVHYPGDEMDNIMVEVGKKAAGAVLDGREWREFPK